MKLRTSGNFFVLITRCYLHQIADSRSKRDPTEIMARANAFLASRAARKALARRHFQSMIAGFEKVLVFAWSLNFQIFLRTVCLETY